ncbi:acyloxyacyl hydrolase [Chitinibacter sp. SCUT-21]|uniref:acyloxyacyl hydrolase n=1 Tax=Chitinibacter sp. SCUT-21 TaxID=2970891 RepID=UPI0035A671BE
MSKSLIWLLSALSCHAVLASDLAIQLGVIAHPSENSALLRVENRTPILAETLSTLDSQLSAYWQINANLWHTNETHFALRTGLGAQYQFSEHWALELGWGAIALDNRYISSQHDMGSQLHFETTLGLRYQLDPRSAIKLNVYHWSNANLADVNPGCEVVFLGYQLRY